MHKKWGYSDENENVKNIIKYIISTVCVSESVSWWEANKHELIQNGGTFDEETMPK